MNKKEFEQALNKIVSQARDVGWFEAEDCTLGNTPFGCAGEKLPRAHEELERLVKEFVKDCNLEPRVNCQHWLDAEIEES